MSKPETPKRCGVCGSELQLNRVFAMPDSWVCVKAGCPAWRWDGEPVPSAPKRDCLCHCHACKQGCPCPEGGRCCPCLCSPEYGLPENHDERCPKYKPAQPAPVSEPPIEPYVDPRSRAAADGLIAKLTAERDALKAQNATLTEMVQVAERDSSASMELYRSAVTRRDDAEAKVATLTAELERLRDLILDIADGQEDGIAEARAIHAAREAGKA